MRFAFLFVMFTAATAAASSPEFPICDSEQPTQGFFAVDEVGPTCAVRWIEAEPIPGGLVFELHTSDGRLAGTGEVITPDELAVPERRHECDGTINDTSRSVFSYSATFLTAQPGDEVWVVNRSGNAFATLTYGSGGCGTFELAATECQVCGPEATMGCADAGGGGATGIAFGLVALVGSLARRRR
ncbi:MAG: hypothetical protein ABI867_26705 [Kofleriaceae bacterium]